MTLRVEGEFCPPNMGTATPPIRIAGEGCLEIHDGEIVVTGFRDGSAAPVFFWIVGILGVLIFEAFTVPDFKAAIMGGTAGASIIVAARLARTARKDKPLQLRIPRDRIKECRVDMRDSGVVLIKVVKHKPKGLIHFRPSIAPDKVLAALKQP